MAVLSKLQSKIDSAFLKSLWIRQSSQSQLEFLVCSTVRFRAEIDHGEGWVQAQGGKYKIFILERRKCLLQTKKYVYIYCLCVIVTFHVIQIWE